MIQIGKDSKDKFKGNRMRETRFTNKFKKMVGALHPTPYTLHPTP